MDFNLIDDLRDKLLCLLAEPHVDSHAIWTLLVLHPYYLNELHRIASWLYSHARVDCSPEDVEQQAIQLLGTDLEGCTDLHLNRIRAENAFRPWLRSVIRHQCQRAMEPWKRRSNIEELSESSLATADPSSEEDFAIDLESMLSRIGPPWSEVLRLYFAGYKLHEIAECQGLTYNQVRWLIHRGREEFAEVFRAYERDNLDADES